MRNFSRVRSALRVVVNNFDDSCTLPAPLLREYVGSIVCSRFTTFALRSLSHWPFGAINWSERIAVYCSAHIYQFSLCIYVARLMQLIFIAIIIIVVIHLLASVDDWTIIERSNRSEFAERKMRKIMNLGICIEWSTQSVMSQFVRLLNTTTRTLQKIYSAPNADRNSAIATQHSSPSHK